jgi:thiol-disulfide isomerase/thioredoxin
MKNIALILLLIAAGCTTKLNQETINIEDEQILVGKVNWDGLTQQPYGEWFTPTYLSYTVDSVSLATLDAKIDEIEVLMFMGTWCSDSHVEVPQFYKILDHLEYDLSRMAVVALERLESRKLVSPQHEEADYDISHVPTFIFLMDGKELGRITEYPEKTLEKDMVRIITNQAF